MTNEEKIIEILDKHFGYHVTQGSDEWYTRNYQNRFLDLQEMAKWKDEQLPKWHRIVEGDFPKIEDDYLIVCQNKNKEDGILLYEIAYYTGEKWENRTHWEDIIAWREIPTF